MRRPARRILYCALALPLAAVLSLALLAAASRTEGGRLALAQAVETFAGGAAAATDLTGDFPADLRVGRLEIRDARGVWLIVENARLAWSPWTALTGRLRVSALTAERVRVERRPEYPATPPESSAGSWPLRLTVDTLSARLELAEPVLGAAAALDVEGAAQLASARSGEARVQARRLDGEGAYGLTLRFDAASVQADAHAQEPPQGLLSRLASLPDLGEIAVQARLEGPPEAALLRADLRAGSLRASAQGTLDLAKGGADLQIEAAAPAMRPGPDLAWQGVELRATARGDRRRPQVRGVLRIDDLSAAEFGSRRVEARIEGEGGALKLDARLERLRVPGPKPDILRGGPAELTAELRLDAPNRPVSFRCEHPLWSCSGEAETAGAPHGAIALRVPDIAPFAELAGLELRGAAQTRLQVAAAGAGMALKLEGRLDIAGGARPWPELLGATRFEADMQAQADGFALSRAEVQGKNLALSLSGGTKGRTMDFSADIALSKLAALSPALAGGLKAQARASGLSDDFAVTAEATGQAGVGDWPLAPLSAKLQARGLPRRAPAGSLTARAALEGAPLAADLTVRPDGQGGALLTLTRAAWKSAQAAGEFAWSPGGALPAGKLEWRVGRLQDFGRWLGADAAGAAEGALELRKSKTYLKSAARNLALRGISARQVGLDAEIDDPVGAHPALAGTLTAEDVAAGALAGAIELKARGPAEALQLQLDGAFPARSAKLNAAATLDARARRLELSAARLDLAGENLRLLAPARIVYAGGLVLENARLGWRQSALEAQGQLAPKLDANARLHLAGNDLAQAFLSGARAEGALDATARLSGTLDRPSGTATLTGEALRALDGAARGLPAAQLRAQAAWAGERIDLQAEANAGPRLSLRLQGSAPLSARGSLDLRCGGAADLGLSDPWLTAAGRRARGQIELNAALTGTPAEPRAEGTIRLDRGEVWDETLGARLGDIRGAVRLDGQELRIDGLEAKAGAGKVAAQGRLDLSAPGWPLSARIQAQQAQALSGDRFSLNLNADLTLQGEARGALAAAGAIHVNRADIRIPERIPARLAVLKVREHGSPPPPPPAPKIGLDLKIRAPGEIFVRGRGLDAELGGAMEVHGALDDPKPTGAFQMRRGQFSLAGQTLIFDRGEVGLNGGKLTDPSLDFAATAARGNVTASLTVGGTAGKPKIVLSGEPELPQDEVLAQLLFGRGAAGLGPLELAQIGAALVSLSGVTSGMANPLEAVRKTLALDRLSVGSDKSGVARVEGGRYVARGVYLGAQQGLSGAQTQGVVQIDVGRHLKVEAALGNAAPTSPHSGAGSVGIKYEYEY